MFNNLKTYKIIYIDTFENIIETTYCTDLLVFKDILQIICKSDFITFDYNEYIIKKKIFDIKNNLMKIYLT